MATLYGTAGNDLINGTTLADYLDGGIGNDTLNGDAGDDVLRGNFGNDSINGGGGNDTAVYFGNRSDYSITYNATTLTFTITDIRPSAQSGVDTVTNIENFRFLDGTIAAASLIPVVQGPFTNGNDVWYGAITNDTLSGLGGNDYIDGGYGNDIINGDAGNDTLRGNYGNDTLNGGADFDTVIYSGNRADYAITYDATTQIYTLTDIRPNAPSGIDKVTNIENFQFTDGTIAAANLLSTGPVFTQGDDVYYGALGNESLNGFGGNDYIDGGYGNDTIYGSAGNDTLRGNYGNDVLDGGIGTDTAQFSGKRADYLITYNTFNGSYLVKDLRPNAPSGIDTVTNIENFQFSDGVVAVNNLNPVPIFTNNNDVWYGGLGNDSLNGLNGNDYIDGGYGHDTIHGGAGNDTLRGNYGNDILDGCDGVDTVQYMGTRADYEITYYSALDQYIVKDLRAGSPSGTDVVTNVENFQFSGSVVSAANLNATVVNGAFVFTTSADNWAGTSGNDSISALAGDDRLNAFAGNDFVDAGAGNDYVNGGAGDDWLIGGLGNDLVQGSDGNDTLFGGTGNDVIDGGSGSDAIAFFGNFNEYSITFNPILNQYFVTDLRAGGQDGTDTVTQVERFSFNGQVYTAAQFVTSLEENGHLTVNLAASPFNL